MYIPLTTGFVLTAVFTVIIIFTLLRKTRLFENQRVSGLIAIVLGFFAAMYEPLVEFLEEFLPLAVMALIIIFFIIFVIDLFRRAKTKDQIPTIVILTILFFIALVFQEKITSMSPVLFNHPDNIIWILGLLFVGLLFYAVYQHGGDEAPPKEKTSKNP